MLWDIEMRDNIKYKEWIKMHFPDKESCVNQCNIAVLKMTRHFPELTVQVGLADKRYHCWAVTKDGNIIDPTFKQFETTVKYTLVANRFLEKDEIELSTGTIFLKGGVR